MYDYLAFEFQMSTAKFPAILVEIKRTGGGFDLNTIWELPSQNTKEFGRLVSVEKVFVIQVVLKVTRPLELAFVAFRSVLALVEKERSQLLRKANIY